MFVHEYNLTCFYTLLLTSLLSQCQVMYCFTELLRNFANVELARQQDLQQPSEKHTEHEMNRWGMFSRGQGGTIRSKVWLSHDQDHSFLESTPLPPPCTP